MIPFPNKKYQIIYADPPWQFEYYSRDWHKTVPQSRSVYKHYNDMSIEDIKLIPVKEISNKDCCLFIWVVNSLLPQGLEVIKEWGFVYKTIAFTWVKQNKSEIGFSFGMGYWTRSNPEICLIATKGSPKRVNAGIRQLILSPKQEHSKKPTEVRNRIVQLCGDLPRIELFARPPKDRLFEDESYKGWDLWGNEV